MKTAALAMTILVAGGHMASAGTYVGAGVGTGADLDGDGVGLVAGGRTLRALFGISFAQLSVEGDLNRLDQNNGESTAYIASVSGKYSIPLSDGFEVFGRAGLQHTTVSGNAAQHTYDVSGNGYLLGGGFEYKLKLIATSASIFIDYTRNIATLNGSTYTASENAGIWMVGATVGL